MSPTAAAGCPLPGCTLPAPKANRAGDNAATTGQHHSTTTTGLPRGQYPHEDRDAHTKTTESYGAGAATCSAPVFLGGASPPCPPQPWRCPAMMCHCSACLRSPLCAESITETSAQQRTRASSSQHRKERTQWQCNRAPKHPDMGSPHPDPTPSSFLLIRAGGDGGIPLKTAGSARAAHCHTVLRAPLHNPAGCPPSSMQSPTPQSSAQPPPQRSAHWVSSPIPKLSTMRVPPIAQHRVPLPELHIVCPLHGSAQCATPQYLSTGSISPLQFSTR